MLSIRTYLQFYIAEQCGAKVLTTHMNAKGYLCRPRSFRYLLDCAHQYVFAPQQWIQ